MELKKGDFYFGTKEEAIWTKVKEASELRLKSFEEGSIIEKAIIELAKQKIEHEKKISPSLPTDKTTRKKG